MIVVLPNNFERESIRRLRRDGFAVSTKQQRQRNLNVAVRVPVLTNVVELRRKS